MARILVIDDNRQIRAIILKACQSWGHHVRDAADGMVATRLMETGCFDLVITDIHMPVMDGIEVLTSLRNDAAKVRILAISGGWSGREKEEVLLDAEMLGADAVLSKPFSLDELRSAVDGLLSTDPPSLTP